MNTLDPAFLKLVEKAATERCMSIVVGIAEKLVVDGTTYGDVELSSDEDFTMFYLDLQQRGILPYLATVNPSLAASYRSRFLRTSGRLMGVR